MSSTNLEVVFEGPAVKDGTIDARLLAESLLGYSEVFTRANALVNGDVSEASVLVQSDFKHGSFIAGLEFLQNFTEQATHLITAHQFLDAGALVGALFAREFVKDLAKETVVGLFRWLRGKKPDEVKPVDQETVAIKKDTETRNVNINVFHMYGDSAIRAGLDKVTRPLRAAQINRITVKQGDNKETIFEKSEAEYFEAEPLQLEAETEPMEGERDAVLVVAKISFKEGTTWTFFERGATVVAKIEDEQFWKKVDNHEVMFGKGDVLRVRLVWKIREVNHQIKAKNTIVKVIEKLDHPKQMRLDRGKDDDVTMRPEPKGRKFRKIREDL